MIQSLPGLREEIHKVMEESNAAKLPPKKNGVIEPTQPQQIGEIPEATSTNGDPTITPCSSLKDRPVVGMLD